MTQDDKVALSTAALLLCALLMQFLQPADITEQPVIGFQVASVHSMDELFAIRTAHLGTVTLT